MTTIDETHDANLRSFAPGADGHPDFPIQNLPFGIFAPKGGAPRAGVAIGDCALDLSGLLKHDLIDGEARRAVAAMNGAALNAFLALGAGPRKALRARLSRLLRIGARERATVEALLHPLDDCALLLPAEVGDYTDFFAGVHHATRVGALLRSDPPLARNYRHMPIAYHGRASSVVVSDTPVRRPLGQMIPRGAPAPVFGPSRRLDYELELACWIGPPSALGEPVAMAQADDHIAGFCLLNDWSARDIQGFESQPLGPFLGKSFATTASAWIVTPEALAPFRMAQEPRGSDAPPLAPYLSDAEDRRAGGYDIAIEAVLSTRAMRAAGAAPLVVGRSHARHMYWTFAQLVAQQTINGCNLRAGDLLASGTISAPDEDGCGSLLELTQGGRRALAMPGGEERRFLEDGDEATFYARCRREGFASIGFGACRGRIAAAPG